MNTKLAKYSKVTDIDEIAEQAGRGEDVSAHFTNRHTAKQRVNVDFPLNLLQAIDTECQRLGVTRQDWIKIVCDDRLRQVHTVYSNFNQ